MNPLATAWSTKVVGNGFAAPGATTMNALSTFFDDCQVSVNLLNKMIVLNLMANDSMGACFTPQYQQSGPTVWSSDVAIGGIGAACLTVNGYNGNGDTGAHFMNTGVIPSTAVPALGVANGGSSTYCFTSGAAASTQQTCGCHDGGGGHKMLMDLFDNATAPPAVSCMLYDFNNSDAGGGLSARSNGFYSMNRTAANRNDVYHATSVIPFKRQWMNHFGVNVTTPPPVAFGFDGVNNNGVFSCSNQTISLGAIHQGLTFMECWIFYNAFVKFRTAIGGGLV